MRQILGFFGLDMNDIITQFIHAALCQTELLPLTKKMIGEAARGVKQELYRCHLIQCSLRRTVMRAKQNAPVTVAFQG